MAHIKTIDELIPPMEVWEGQVLGNVAGALGLNDGVRGGVSTPVPTPSVPPEVKAFPQAPTVLPVEGRAASTGRCWVFGNRAQGKRLYSYGVVLSMQNDAAFTW